MPQARPPSNPPAKTPLAAKHFWKTTRGFGQGKLVEWGSCEQNDISAATTARPQILSCPIEPFARSYCVAAMTTGSRCSFDVAPPHFFDPWAVFDNSDFVANVDTYQCWEDAAMQLNGQPVQPALLTHEEKWQEDDQWWENNQVKQQYWHDWPEEKDEQGKWEETKVKQQYWHDWQEKKDEQGKWEETNVKEDIGITNDII